MIGLTTDVRPHPITTEGRRVKAVEARDGATLADLVARHWPHPTDLPIVAVNRQPVPSAEWAARPLAPGDVVTLRAAVAGGDSDPLRTIATIAIIVAAVHYGGPLGAAIGFAEGSALGAAVGSALITLGGQLVVDALLPLPTPDAGGAGAAPESVYTLSGARNRTRPYEPLPLLLGRHRMVPDLAAQPYAEFEGDDQYLFSVFGFGLGSPVISDLKIGNTAITDYADVTMQWGDARGRTTLVASHVDTLEGGVLDDATVWTTRTASAGAARLAIDLVGRVFRVDNRGDYQSHSVVVDVELVADARVIRSQATLRGDDQSAIRVTHTLDVPTTGAQPSNGRWQVRCRRLTAPSTDDQVYDDVTWQAMRSYLEDATDYSGQTRLAVKIRASGQLSGALDQVTAMGQSLAPVWDPAADDGSGDWSEPRATRNPAWLFRWFALGIRVAGRLAAGAGLPQARIDDASIRAWGAWCDAQGWTCDVVLTRSMSMQAALEMIAACGRASPTWSSGRLGVVWEDLARPASAFISAGNIVAGSLEVQYAGGAEVDEVNVRYTEPAADWQRRTLRRSAGIGAPARSVTLDLHGVTAAANAAKFANLALARQRHQRRRMRWRMGPDALTSIHRGDVVYMSHALIDGGLAGRCASIEGAVVGLDRSIRIAAGAHSMLLALPDGRLHQAAVTSPAAESNTQAVTLATAPPVEGHAIEPADVLWRLYADTAPPLLARVVGVEPQADGTATVTAVDEPPEYRAAIASDLTTPTLIPASDVLPVVTSIWAWTEAVEATIGDVTEVHIEVETSGGWRGGEVVVTDGPSAGPKGVIGPTERRLSWIAPRAGTLDIRVIPRGNPGGRPASPISSKGLRCCPGCSTGGATGPPTPTTRGTTSLVAAATPTSASPTTAPPPPTPQGRPGAPRTGTPSWSPARAAPRVPGGRPARRGRTVTAWSSSTPPSVRPRARRRSSPASARPMRGASITAETLRDASGPTAPRLSPPPGRSS